MLEPPGAQPCATPAPALSTKPLASLFPLFGFVPFVEAHCNLQLADTSRTLLNLALEQSYCAITLFDLGKAGGGILYLLFCDESRQTRLFCREVLTTYRQFRLCLTNQPELY
jgi:hypothetical protein